VNFSVIIILNTLFRAFTIAIGMGMPFTLVIKITCCRKCLVWIHEGSMDQLSHLPIILWKPGPSSSSL
jgi:hypothetical protein